MTGSSQNVYAKKYLVNYRVTTSGDTSSQSVVQQFKRQNVTKKKPDMNENSQIDCKENRSHSGKRSFYCQTNQSARNDTEVKPNLNRRYSKSDKCPEPSRKKVRHDCLELEEVTDSGGCSGASTEVSSDEDRCQEYLQDDDTEYKEGVPDIGADPGSPKWVSRVVSLDHNYASGPRVRWGEVRVWYFERHQYSCAVPSHGDVALGMADTHSHTEHTSLGREEAELQGVSTKHKVRRRAKDGRLKPLTMSARLSMLRAHGVHQVDREESAAIETIQASRAEHSGCDCRGGCDPETCSCALNQIGCEVDTEGFPCRCSLGNCANPQGRKVYNRKEIDIHRWSQVDSISPSKPGAASSRSGNKVSS